MRWRNAWLGMAGLPVLWASVLPTAPKESGDFAEVRAIFRAQCVGCHTAKEPSGGLDLETLAGIRKYADGKKGIIAGDPDKSVLLRRIRGLDGLPRMPMGFAPLTAEQERAISDWIRTGAPLEAKDKKHWAYIPPARPEVPAGAPHPVDAFVRAKLAEKGLKPSPRASKETLIRRLSLDLLGLPPSVEEVDAFLADKRPDAYERLVDRYLASPHYGERQARYWLDLARYADSNGYEKDGLRNAWKYRDWVIDSYNRNQRFDQFTVEQIAGDLLPKRSLDQLIATGFHRNTMFNQEGGVDKEEGMYEVRLDRVNTTSTVWMGSTLECARCHDHKYDPFSHQEYFSLFAFFNNNQYESRGSDEVSEAKYYEPEIPAPSPEQQSYLDDLDRRIVQASGEAKAKLEAERKRFLERVPTAMVIFERPGAAKLEAMHRSKGAFTGEGPMVPAAVPAIFGVPLPDGKADRLALAKWLVDRRHPLTARVQVNRMWERHFGTGIVETSEDFGTQSSPPTHPELLDWLAVEFMESGWNVKAMHRLIVTSETYKQDSRVRPDLAEKDPRNLFVARGPRFRLDAETIRDSALAIGGLLARDIGGPSVYPPQPDGIWDSPYSGDRYVTSPGKDRYRRGIYTVAKRTAPYASFLAFDSTSREQCTVRRSRTNTPLQALVLMNDPVYLEAAQGLAKRMESLEHGFRIVTSRRPTPAERDRLEKAWETFRAKYEANPTLAAPLGGPEAAARTMLASVLLNLDEAINLP